MATGGGKVLGSNVESVAFRKHFEELLTAIQEPEALAAGLYTRDVGTQALMGEVGRAIDSRVEGRPSTLLSMVGLGGAGLYKVSYG